MRNTECGILRSMDPQTADFRIPYSAFSKSPFPYHERSENVLPRRVRLCGESGLAHEVAGCVLLQLARHHVQCDAGELSRRQASHHTDQLAASRRLAA